MLLLWCKNELKADCGGLRCLAFICLFPRAKEWRTNKHKKGAKIWTEAHTPSHIAHSANNATRIPTTDHAAGAARNASKTKKPALRARVTPGDHGCCPARTRARTCPVPKRNALHSKRAIQHPPHTQTIRHNPTHRKSRTRTPAGDKMRKWERQHPAPAPLPNAQTSPISLLPAQQHDARCKMQWQCFVRERFARACLLCCSVNAMSVPEELRSFKTEKQC